MDLRNIRNRLAAAASKLPPPTRGPRRDEGLFHGTSEQAYAEVMRLLAAARANPSTETWDPTGHHPEIVAIVEGMEREQKSMVRP